MRHQASPGVLRGSGRRLRQQLVLAGEGARVPSRDPSLVAAAVVAARRPWRVSVVDRGRGGERRGGDIRVDGQSSRIEGVGSSRLVLYSPGIGTGSTTRSSELVKVTAPLARRLSHQSTCSQSTDSSICTEVFDDWLVRERGLVHSLPAYYLIF